MGIKKSLTIKPNPARNRLNRVDSACARDLSDIFEKFRWFRLVSLSHITP